MCLHSCVYLSSDSTPAVWIVQVCGRYAQAHPFFLVYMLSSLAFIHHPVRVYASAFHGMLVAPRLTPGIRFPPSYLLRPCKTGLVPVVYMPRTSRF